MSDQAGGDNGAAAGNANAGAAGGDANAAGANSAGSGNDNAGAGAGAAGGGDSAVNKDGGQSQFAIPDAYKDKPWAKDFKSADDVFKSLENAQQFIGRKGFGVPGEKATAEEKAQFYAELGVPPDPKGYEFKRPDGITDEQWDSKHEEKWAGLMKEHNVPKSVANALRDEMIKETLDKYTAGTKTLNEILDKSLGDKKQSLVKEAGAVSLKAITDPNERKMIEEFIGDKHTPAAALFAVRLNEYYKKTYGLSDTNGGDQDGNNGGQSIKEMRAEATKLMASEAYTNTMHKDHAETRKRVDGMYADIGKLTDAQKKR